MRTPLAPILLAAGLAGAAGCTTLNAFEVTLDGETTIHGDQATAGSVLTRIPAIGSFASIDFASSEAFKQNQTTIESVRSLRVVQLEIQIVHPDGQGFDFLDELHFFAGAGSEEKEVAGKSGIAQLGLVPPNPKLWLEVDPSAELRPLLDAPSISLTARGSGRVPPQDTTLLATVTLRVELQLF
ncbi:MAG TPA: hypothetical protein VIG99_17470 [Myxococcaceae bacterium]|jgi:hypothetical protein